MNVRLTVLTIVASAVLGCKVQPETPAAAAASSSPQPSRIVVEELASPAGPGAAEPFLFASREGALLSWLEPVKGSDRVALRLAQHRGGQWSPHQTVIERSDLFVNWADFPSIVEDGKGVLFAHWLQKSGSGTYSYDVRMASSKDGGRTWGESFLLHRDGTKTEHGFVSLAALADGGVGATWLDGRHMGEGGHDGPGGDMTIRYAKVDASGVITDDAELDDRTCECCTTGMASPSAGPVVLYRDRSSDEIRDISFVRRSATGWTKPQSLAVDGWKIAGCPVNGPQADAMGEHVAAAWFTAAEDRSRSFIAFSHDSGATFGKPVVIDDGKPIGRVDVVLVGAREALVVWLEENGKSTELRARIVGEAGSSPSIKVGESSSARSAGFPRIARVGNEVWVAWTDQREKIRSIRLSRLRVS